MYPIKVRAYNAVTGVMFSAETLGADQLTLSADGRGFVNVSGKSQRLSEFYSHLIQMLGVGRTDRNGQGVFDGDIVMWPGRFKGDALWCFVVTIRDGDARMVGTISNAPVRAHPLTSVNQCEVVGHIFEKGHDSKGLHITNHPIYQYVKEAF